VEAAATPLLRVRGRIDVAPLLAILAPLALLAATLAIVLPALVVQDSWLALVDGREVAEHGLPHVDHLAALTMGHRWVDQQWLGQLVLYEAARLGGVGASFAVCLACALGALALCLHVAYRRGASPLALLAFSLLAVAAAPWGLQLRTQSFALLFFALTLWLLERRSLVVLPVLALWANVHGSVVVGVALVLAYALVARHPVLTVAPAMLFVSPYALSLPGYYRLMLVDPPFGKAVNEWHRTKPCALTAVFFAVVLVALLLARRLDPFAQVVLLLTFAIGLDAMRGIVWFALAALAYLPAAATRRPRRLSGPVAGSFACLAGVAVVAALAWAGTRDGEQGFPAKLLSVRGPVLANEATADWLLWRRPDLRIAYDVRFELASPAQIDRLIAWRRFEPGWRGVAAGYRTVVDDPAHVARLVAGGGWRRIASSDDVAAAERVP
jgi:hypothetical protein